ncbi:tetratricopeptide repeat protein [Sphingomonas psychrotolerans]|uniref:Tetratricopeptide repeat protein n=1 Tax=Sphingomonas psychrotolerans TaxID=1327635 RepID=A0ABU3MZT0_9SPHN|nr:tetratricopeptide repeat protein [Sphingomonas psychrotolerans]MDT8757795.1 tetratricopeptide repeat protein [Sphingomonas psychrotolerans]
MIRGSFWVALALVSASPAVAQAPAQQETPEQVARNAKLGEAVAAIQSQKPAEATAILKPLLADYEKLYAGEKRKIYCAHDPQQALLYMGQAAAAKQEAVAIEPGWCIALWARGFALIDQQQLDAAVPFLERAVALSPSHAHYLSELGYAYQSQKKWQLSYDLYSRAATAAALEEGDKRKRSLRRAWFGMGFDLIELGRLDEAEALFKKCLELFPDDQKVKSELDYLREQRAKKS